jgi:hypothetical protein
MDDFNLFNPKVIHENLLFDIFMTFQAFQKISAVVRVVKRGKLFVFPVNPHGENSRGKPHGENGENNLIGFNSIFLNVRIMSILFFLFYFFFAVWNLSFRYEKNEKKNIVRGGARTRTF